jgi:hypothetical protein
MKIEQKTKNLHIHHLEDLLFECGIGGLDSIIFYIQNLDLIQKTIKIDGSPAIFFGKDPSDGKFFIAKKSIFNKSGSKIYKTKEEISNDIKDLDLQYKLMLCFDSCSSMEFPDHIVFQGDFLFSDNSLNLNSQFKPNTLTYTSNNSLKGYSVGLFLHTIYTGTRINDMHASYETNILKYLNKIPFSCYIIDCDSFQVNYDRKKFEHELGYFEYKLRLDRMRLDQIHILERITSDLEYRIRIQAYINSCIRNNTDFNVAGLIQYLDLYFKGEELKRKSPPGKEAIQKKKSDYITFITENQLDFETLFDTYVTVMNAKSYILDSFQVNGPIKSLTEHEGYVLSHDIHPTAKLVNRYDFSRLNFLN